MGDATTRKLLAGRKLPKHDSTLFTHDADPDTVTVADFGDYYAIWSHRDGVITRASYVRKLQWQAIQEVRDRVMTTQLNPNDIEDALRDNINKLPQDGMTP